MNLSAAVFCLQPYAAAVSMPTAAPAVLSQNRPWHFVFLLGVKRVCVFVCVPQCVPVRRCAASVHPPLSLDNVTHETCARLRCQTARGKSAWVYSVRERKDREETILNRAAVSSSKAQNRSPHTLNLEANEREKTCRTCCKRGGGAAERPDRNVSLF